MNKAMLLKQYMFNNKKKSRLPSAYQEVEYIESTGTQYIDTLYKLNDNKLKVQIKFRITDWNESSFYFGCGSVGESNAFTASTSYLAIGANSISAFPNQDSMVGVINELEMEANESTKKYSFSIIKGISGTGSYSGTIKSNLSMPIFKGTLYSSCCDCRVYSFRLYVNDVLVRDFIPCYRKSDNEIGLYDIVNNQFYTNQGTGSFLCGRPLVYDTIAGYEQIDYIETTGTQYIDTGIYQNSSARKYIIETSFNAIDTPSYIIRGNYDYIAETFQIDDKGNYYIGYCGSEKGVAGAVANEKNSFECYFSNGNQYVKKNGTTIISMSKAYSSSYSYKITIFKGSVVGTWAKAKLYYLSIYSNNTIIRDFIPMRRKLDNELGLYDLVNKVFYTNQGSGEFIAGSEV